MKVLLTADVDDLGMRGDIVDVAAGYGRNYLLPRGMAVKATEGSIQNAEQMRRAREETERRVREEAENIAQSIAGTHVVIAAQAGDEGKLFGSVGTADVVEGVKKFTGVELDRRQVHVESPIRSIGLHEATVTLHPDVKFTLTLDVIPA